MATADSRPKSGLRDTNQRHGLRASQPERVIQVGLYVVRRSVSSRLLVVAT